MSSPGASKQYRMERERREREAREQSASEGQPVATWLSVALLMDAVFSTAGATPT
jgi:hypothetical protein